MVYGGNVDGCRCGSLGHNLDDQFDQVDVTLLKATQQFILYHKLHAPLSYC